MGRTNSAYTSIPQQKALAIVPKVSSAFSLLGSLYIVYDVAWRIPKEKRKLYHRILLGMSISDTLASVAWFCSTWPTDPDVLDIWGAAGTQQTCTLQGFFAQTPLATVVYSGWLSVYYYLVIRRGWSHHHLTRSKIEYWIHPSATLLGLSTAIASVSLGILNPLGFTCWIAAVPLGCDETWLTGSTTCTRGDNSKLYQWVFWYIPLWIIILLVTVIMCSIVWKFYVQERHNELYRRRAVGGNKQQSVVLRKWSHSKLRDIVWQSLFYVGSFYLTWIFPTILRIVQNTDGVVWYHWEMLTAAFVPSQGIWNAIIYLRPQFVKHRKARQRQTRGAARLNLGTVSAVSADEVFPGDSNYHRQSSLPRDINPSSLLAGGSRGVAAATMPNASAGQEPPAGSLQQSDKTRPHETPLYQMPEERSPQRFSLHKEDSRFKARASLLGWFQDAKDVILMGDAGVNHDYFDDSNVVGASSSIEQQHWGDVASDEDGENAGRLDDSNAKGNVSTSSSQKAEVSQPQKENGSSPLSTTEDYLQPSATLSVPSLGQSNMSSFEDDPQPVRSSIFGMASLTESSTPV